MSFLERILPCPCRTWRCRLHYAARILAIVVLAIGIVTTTGVTGHGPASCTYQGWPVQAGQMIAPHGRTLACLDGQLVEITFPGTPWIGAQASTVMHAAEQLRPAALTASITGTPAQEWAACTAAAELRGHQLEHARVPSSAWWWTWRTADHADPELRHLIHRWMRTGRGWRPVYEACNPDA